MRQPDWVSYDYDPLELEVEVSYNGLWYSLNDLEDYQVGPDGFGNVQQTLRRQEITSSYFDGTFGIGTTRDNTKRQIDVWVHGRTYAQMKNAQARLVGWFSQDDYAIRITRDDSLETWRCEAADYSIDEGHVNMHNRISKVSFQITVRPDVTVEMVV